MGVKESETVKKLMNLASALHNEFVAQYNVNDFPLLVDVFAMISTESSWNPNGDSGYARGLMQISKPALNTINNIYGKHFTYDDMFDAWKNIYVGVRYMRWIYKYLAEKKGISKLDVAIPFTVMAYNWGIGNFTHWLNKTQASNNVIDEIVPFETKNHLLDYMWWKNHWSNVLNGGERRNEKLRNGLCDSRNTVSADMR